MFVLQFSVCVSRSYLGDVVVVQFGILSVSVARVAVCYSIVFVQSSILSVMSMSI